MNSGREIIYEIKVDGRTLTATSDSPVNKLEIRVATKDRTGREELQLGFVLDVTPGTGQSPTVDRPQL